MKVHELGHLVLYVRDLERSRRFYRDVLGFARAAQPRAPASPPPPSAPGAPTTSCCSSRSASRPRRSPAAAGSGMYHFGLKVGTTDDELREALATLEANDVTVVGTSDHGVTHSLYIEDPDGNEIELYIDVQPELWRDDPSPPSPHP